MAGIIALRKRDMRVGRQTSGPVNDEKLLAEIAREQLFVEAGLHGGNGGLAAVDAQARADRVAIVSIEDLLDFEARLQDELEDEAAAWLRATEVDVAA